MTTLAEWVAQRKEGQTSEQPVPLGNDGGSMADRLRTMALSSAIGMSLRGGSFGRIAEESGVLNPEAYQVLSGMAPPEWVQQKRASGDLSVDDLLASAPSLGPSPFLSTSFPNIRIEPEPGDYNSMPSGPAPPGSALRAALGLTSTVLSAPALQRFGAGFDLLSQSIPNPINPVLPGVPIPFGRELSDIRTNFKVPVQKVVPLATGNNLYYGTYRHPNIPETFGELVRRIKAEWDVAAHGKPWDEQSALTYANVLGRRMGGPGGPVFETARWVGGIGADIFTDPLIMIGPATRLGTAAKLARRLPEIANSLGLVGDERTVSALRFLKEMGREVPLSEKALEFAANYERAYGTIERPGLVAEVARGERGLLQLPRFSKYPFPGLWSTDTQGRFLAESSTMKGIKALTGGRILSVEMKPIGSQLLAPYARWLESKGVSDGWTLLDMLYPSDATRALAHFYAQPEIELTLPRAGETPFATTEEALHAATREGIIKPYIPRARAEAGRLMQGMSARQEDVARAIMMSEPDARRMGLTDLKFINETAKAVLDKRIAQGGQKLTADGYRTELEAMKLQLQQFFNDQQEVRKLVSEGIPGIDTTPILSTPNTQWVKGIDLSGETAAIKVPKLEVSRVKAKSPLTFTPKPEWVSPEWPGMFDTPQIRDWVQELAGRQKWYVELAQSGGLRTKLLTPTDRTPLQELTLAMQDLAARRTFDPKAEGMYMPEAADYLRHQMSKETWGILRKPEIGVIVENADGSYGVSKKFINTWSTTMSTRANREGITQFNAKVWNEGFGGIPARTVRNFFETNPAIREPVRYMEAIRQMKSGKFYNGLADFLANTPEYIIGPDGKMPQGFKALTDFLPERTVAAMDDVLKAKVDGVMLPDTPGIRRMIQTQTDLMTSQKHLDHFLGFMQTATNWWKVNTLGVFPAYHLGNFISNLYLLYLNGMWDPTMLALAYKIAKNPTSLETVGSAWTGQKYTYKQLSEMMHGYNIGLGWTRSTMEDAIRGSADALRMKDYQAPENYQFLGIPGKAATIRAGQYDLIGITKMLTGMDWRIERRAGETFFQGLLNTPSEVIGAFKERRVIEGAFKGS